MPNGDIKNWALISGASTGIGRATALLLAKRGFHVLAGIRRMADAESIASEPTIIPLLLDVTDEDSIANAVARARELSAHSGLKVVINNAGIVVPGPLEYVPAAEWRRQFDVNFFGMVELTRATLPLLRQAVAAHGVHAPRLLFVSSIGGRVSQPILAPYTTSKFATNALGDSMRLELRRQGIGVSVIEPGAIATAIWSKGDTASSQFTPNHPARKLYDAEIEGVLGASKKAAQGAIPATAAAEEILRAVTASRAPARVLIGTQAKIMAALRRWLPLSWFDSLILKAFLLNGLPIESQPRP